MKKMFFILFTVINLTAFAQVELNSTGSANAYLIAFPGVFSYSNGISVTFKANFDNTASASVNVNGLGDKPIKKHKGDNLAANDIKDGQVVTLVYDGSFFQITSGLGNAPSGGGGGNPAWELGGNTGTDSTANFIGTADEQPLLFHSGNAERMKLRQDGGIETYMTNSNIALGQYALPKNTGSSNIAVGRFSLNANTSNFNTAIGNTTLTTNSSGQLNTAVGSSALYNNTTGSNNAALGSNALLSNTQGGNNSAVGLSSLYSNTTGSNNVAIGNAALLGNTTGSNNTALGKGADVSSNNLSNATAVGSNAVVAQSNSLVLGDTANIKVGIRTGIPTEALHIKGQVRIDTVTTAASGDSILTISSTGVIRKRTAASLASGGGAQTLSISNDTLSISGGNAVVLPGGGSSGWSLTGNAGTDTATNFIGTTDNTDLVFKINSTNAGRLTNAGNVSFGINSSDFTGGNGTDNVAIGNSAMQNNTIGGSNTAIGSSALNSNYDGHSNVAMGDYALGDNISGYGNVGIGAGANSNNETGEQNTAIGISANVGAPDLINATAIGAQARVDASNSMVLGSINGVGDGEVNTYIGIGTTTPQAKLDINATDEGEYKGFRLRDGNEQAGYVLTANDNGFATWQPAGGGSTGGAITGDACSGSQTITFCSGSIEDGSGGSDYDNNLDCEWHIYPNAATGVTLTFTSFDLESGDYVRITDDSYDLLGQFTGNTIPGPFTITSGFLTISFNTDGSGTAPGWAATYSCTAPPALPWSTYGNAGTNPSGNFIGTTDERPLLFRTNNLERMKLRLDGGMALYDDGENIRIGRDYDDVYYNPGIQNVAIGSGALYSTWSDAVGNTAIGTYSLNASTTGNLNVAIGRSALTNSTVGHFNTAVGYEALVGITTGSYNTALGRNASSYANGDKFTAIGAHSFIGTGAVENTTVLGYNAIANASNKIRLGDVNVTVVEGQVAYTFPSDGRFKTNISAADVSGLSFITKLRPVNYNFDTRKFEEFLTQNMPDSIRRRHLTQDFTKSTALRQTGFIAQEVEAAAKEAGYDFSGGLHIPENETDNYSVAYSQFVVPLVKAVQELNEKIETLQKENNELKGKTTPTPASRQTTEGFRGDENPVITAQQKEIDALKTQNSTTKTQLDEMQKQLEELKKLLEKK